MHPSEGELRAQLESLRDELASRQSPRHFAHAAVAMMLSLIIAGTAAKVSWDTQRHWYAGMALGALAVAVWVYSVSHYLRGKRLLQRELAQFESLRAVRRALRVDDPHAFLPP